MHRRLISGFLLALAAVCGLSPESLAAELVDTPDVPVEIAGRVILLQAHINGTGPMSFILDTGATETVIVPSAATKAGIVSHRASPTQYKGTVESISVGSAEVNRLDVFVFDPPQALSLRLDKGINYSGILGYTFLSRFITTIDYGRSTVRLVPIASWPKDKWRIPAGAFVVPCQVAGGSILVRGAVNGRGPVTFVLDTGSAEVLIVPKVAQALGLAQSAAPEYPGVGFSRLERVALGQAGVVDVPAIVHSLPAERQAGYSYDGILGYPFLSHFKVTLNYRDRLLVLEVLSPEAKEKTDAVP